MRPEVEVGNSGNVIAAEASTPHTRPYGKSPMTETPFNSFSYDLTISFTPLQPTSPPSSYIPFGTIIIPISK